MTHLDQHAMTVSMYIPTSSMHKSKLWTSLLPAEQLCLCRVVAYAVSCAVSCAHQVTKAEIEEEKERLKAVDARPIKKVAEAKARKRKRLQVRHKTRTVIQPLKAAYCSSQCMDVFERDHGTLPAACKDQKECCGRRHPGKQTQCHLPLLHSILNAVPCFVCAVQAGCGSC